MQVVYVGLLLFSVTQAAQEEKSKDSIALHHFDKRRNQEPTSKETSVQGKEKNLPIFEAKENNQSSKSSHLSADRERVNGDYSLSHRADSHSELVASVYPESVGDRESEDGAGVLSPPHDQEEYGTTLARKSTQLVQVWTDKSKEKNPQDVPNTSPSGIDSVQVHPKNDRNNQRDLQAHDSPGENKRTLHIRRSTHYLKRLPQVQEIPSDFEGSGSPDVQGRGDNDVAPFSGDGGKGGPDAGSTTSPGNAEGVKPGSNEIPGLGGDTAGAARVGLVEGDNDIAGSTNFRDLPGKEGNRVDAGSQNAHRGKVEFHYPQVSSKEKTKEGRGDHSDRTHYNDIPKGGSRKGTEESTRKQVILDEKQRYSSKNKSPGLLIPSHGFDEIKNEIIDSPNAPSKGRHIQTHGRQNHYVPQGQSNYIRKKGSSQQRAYWHYRRPHASGSFRPPEREGSSESSDSSSSSESDGD